MKRFLFLGLLLLWSVSMRAQTNQVGVFKMLVDVVDARTIADNGGGTAATLTLTPRGSFVTITCNDTDGCAITLGETGVRSGQQLRLFNLSANAVTLADSAGVQELQSSVSLAQYASIDCEYLTDRWSCGGSGGGSGTVTTTGSPASGNLAFFSGASSITSGNLSGDVTTSGTGAATIANDAVSNAKLRNSGALSVIGRSANSSGDPADISASAASDAVLRESGSTIGFGTIATGGIANDAVTFAKIQNASGASVLVGRGSASGAGDFQEITLGAGLSMAGTSLSSTVVGTGGGDVVGPSSATDNAIARFDSTTGKLIQNSVVTVSDAGAIAFPDGVSQTFNPDGTNAGLNVGSQAGDPSSLNNGDIWYNSSGNALKARIDGATVALGSGGGMALLEQHSASSSATLDFTTWYSSTYDEYQIELINVIPATDVVDLKLRVSTDGGSTWKSGGSDYSWATYRFVTGFSGVGASNGDSSIDLATGGGADVSNTTSKGGVNGTFRIIGAGNTSVNTTVTALNVTVGSGGAAPVSAVGGGQYLATTAVDAFQVFFSSGNIASGTVRVYGIVK